MPLKIKISPCEDGSYELEIPDELDYLIEKITIQSKYLHNAKEKLKKMKQEGVPRMFQEIYKDEIFDVLGFIINDEK